MTTHSDLQYRLAKDNLSRAIENFVKAGRTAGKSDAQIGKDFRELMLYFAEVMSND